MNRSNDFDKLTKDNLTYSIDVTGLAEGTHQVDLKLDIDDTLYTYQTVAISVEISVIQNDTEDTENTDNPGLVESAEVEPVTE